MSLVLRDVHFAYADLPILRGAALEVAAGEIVCLFGPSGCGKTTLLRIAAGLEVMQRGAVLINGELVADAQRSAPPEERPVGFVFQEFVLFPHLTALENAAFAVKADTRAERRRRATDELARVGLADFAERYPHQLSGGQQQRVALARAFARKPQAVLLDEPFASIDAVLRRKLRTDLRLLLKARNTPAVLVTHDPEEALEIGDRIALMRAGEIVETAAPGELYRNPRTVEGATIFPGAQQIVAAIRDGAFVSAFGKIEGPGGNADKDAHKDGGTASIVAGAGAVSARENPDGGAIVIDVRDAGAEIVHILQSRTDPDLTIRATAGAALSKGAVVSIAIDPERARIF